MSNITAERPRTVAWARVYPAFKRAVAKALRRGAWYPVVRNDQDDRVSLMLGSRLVDVPRRLLEIRPHRPGHFSVVTRAEYKATPGRVSKHHLGRNYVVCPGCGDRFALFGEPAEKICPSCGHRGEVGWWEA